jgi:glycosyltransferase involved in cell wall biosynthesis
MNIALLIESLAGGGAEQVVQRLARGLAQRGEHVFVYCLKDAGSSAGGLQTAGVTVRQARSFGRDPLLPWRLGDWLKRDRIALAHAHSCAALVRVFPAAQLLRVPLIHVWHGWPLGSPTRDHRIALRLDRWIARVGVNSQSLRPRLPTPRHARTAAYLPNGIDLPPVVPADARRRLEVLHGRKFGGPIILSVANVRIEKDLCGLLAAFARLRRQRSDAHLVCIGAVRDVANWQLVQRAAKSPALESRVHFPGPVRDAWRLMAGADVFCLSSRTESMPNVILEAMTQRAPIVATAVGDVGTRTATEPGDHWLLRHDETGLLVPPGAPQALAAALDYALRDPEAARRRAARAFDEHRRRFTTEHMVQRYVEVYEEMLGRRRQPRRAVARSRRRTVLMLGPAAPQIGGMVTSIDLLMRSPLREHCVLHRCATPAPRGASQGPVRRLMRHLQALAGLAWTLIGRRVDILHIHTCSYRTFYRSLLDLAVAKGLGRAVVLHIRGGQFEHFCRRASRSGQWLIRRGFECADAAIVVSNRWRGIVQRHAGSTPVIAIPNAVEPFTLAGAGGQNGRPCRFLYLGKLTVAKGLADLIRAAAQLRADGTSFELVIAGPAADELRSRWERSVQAAGLTDVATFAGVVRGAAKSQLLRAADCFVHPSHSEALPNAVLEAAAAGLPVIATAVGSLAEALTAAGDTQPLCPLVPPHDAPALAQAMQRLARDAAARRRIGAALQQHVMSCFSPTHVAGQLAQVYERVLARPRGDRGWRVARP